MTLKDMLIAGKLAGGGGGEEPSGTKQISISANGTVTENVKDYASAEITAAVPNSYTAGDEGKVVSSGALVSQSSDSVTQNGTVDTTLINSLTVNVAASGISVDDIAQNLQPSGAVVLGSGVTAIADHAFQGKAITSIKGVSVTTMGRDSFADTQLTGISDSDFPVLGVNTLCSVLLRLPTTCTSIKLSGEKIALNSGSSPLRDCKGLVTAEFPNAGKNVGTSNEGMATNTFYGCTNLELVDCGFVKSIGSYAFQNCSKLDTIILRKTSLVALSNINAFISTKYASGGAGGTIYIPKVLYDHLGDNSADDYQNASNWSTVHGYGTITWAKIEGSIYE